MVELGLGIRLCLRSPIFSDVEIYRKRRGNRPQKVFLAIPHANERQVASPFMKALGDRLVERGVEVQKANPLEVRRLGWKMDENRFVKIDGLYGQGDWSNELRKNVMVPEDCEHNEVISGVFTLIDYYYRVGFAQKCLSANPFSMIIELHAYPQRDENESFFEVCDCWRVDRTGILISKSYYSDLKETFEKVLKKAGECWRFAEKIAGFFGFDMGMAIRRIGRALQAIKEMDRRILVLEIPGKGISLPKRHPMYSHYFRNKPDGDVVFRPVSYFEEAYCAHSYESVGFTQKDVDAVASVAVLPPKKS